METINWQINHNVAITFWVFSAVDWYTNYSCKDYTAAAEVVLAPTKQLIIERYRVSYGNISIVEEIETMTPNWIWTFNMYGDLSKCPLLKYGNFQNIDFFQMWIDKFWNLKKAVRKSHHSTEVENEMAQLTEYILRVLDEHERNCTFFCWKIVVIVKK